MLSFMMRIILKLENKANAEFHYLYRYKTVR